MKSLKAVTLEMSLKPFFSAEQSHVETVCRKLFEDWKPLTRRAETVCVMLWAADGSEILDYTGRMDGVLEWSKYIGGANPLLDWDKQADPGGIGLHTRPYLYREHPPELTNGFLKGLVATLKKIGGEITGLPVLVGETFDPGPEFAVSDFKYRRHQEICVGESMGRKSMVCCYARLNGDDREYAEYPGGIPDGTPFGTFFGRQAQRFLSDMGFDYLWLSNGFGFGTETWKVNGVTFDGVRFYPERMEETIRNILEFWTLFRREFHLPVQTRGTNLTAGIDLATDGVDCQKIYGGDFNILAPPNSPWAALDGDFGLELAGYMSRIAHLPAYDGSERSFQFRFYVHDPWWMNSPWIDRYEGQPHDIYLPLAVSRINERGGVDMPDRLNILTVDNSLGEMPESCVNEVIPHLLKCYDTAPDAPSPFVWVYPFHEYHERPEQHISGVFFEDWFLINAINSGLPVSTVIASDSFTALFEKDPGFLHDSILVLPAPRSGSPMAAALLSFVERGGRAMLYGSLANADERVIQALGARLTAPLEGEMRLHTILSPDALRNGEQQSRIVYGGALSDGGVCEQSCGGEALAEAVRGNERRAVLLHSADAAWKGGAMVWCRGLSCSRAEPDRDMAPLTRYFVLAAERLGYAVRLVKQTRGTGDPVLTLHRSGGALWWSAYNPDTTTDLHLGTPLGAPLLTGWETVLQDGLAVYRLPRACRAQCRVFIRQRDGVVVGCKERAPVSYRQRHKLEVNGLEDAAVYVLPPDGGTGKLELLLNSRDPHVIGQPFEMSEVDTPYGRAVRAEHITGTLQISDLM